MCICAGVDKNEVMYVENEITKTWEKLEELADNGMNDIHIDNGNLLYIGRVFKNVE